MSALPSLITMNCASAYVYQRVEAPYRSPLVGGLFLGWTDYLRFLADLPRSLAAPLRFAEPTARYLGTDRTDYPVSFHGDVPLHWIHARDAAHVAEWYGRGLAAIDWDNLAVVFCESNFGASPLSDDEWSFFKGTWEALPYRKAYLSTGRYGPVDAERRIKHWAGRDHTIVCDGGDRRCKSDCRGCGRAAWGQFTHEGMHIVRWLDLPSRLDDTFRINSRVHDYAAM